MATKTRTSPAKRGSIRSVKVTADPVDAVKELLSPVERTHGAQIQAVKDYANYCVGKGAPHDRGWDIVLETWTAEDYVRTIGKARSTVGAVNKVAAVVKMMADHRDDVRSA